MTPVLWKLCRSVMNTKCVIVAENLFSFLLYYRSLLWKWYNWLRHPFLKPFLEKNIFFIRFIISSSPIQNPCSEDWREQRTFFCYIVDSCQCPDNRHNDDDHNNREKKNLKNTFRVLRLKWESHLITRNFCKTYKQNKNKLL